MPTSTCCPTRIVELPRRGRKGCLSAHLARQGLWLLFEKQIEHAPGLVLVWDARIKWRKAPRCVHPDRLVSDQVEVEVDTVFLVPELLVYRLGGPLRSCLKRRGILLQNACDLREVTVRLAQKGVEEYVLHEEGTALADASLVVVALGEELDEPGEPVVGGVQRSISDR